MHPTTTVFRKKKTHKKNQNRYIITKKIDFVLKSKKQVFINAYIWLMWILYRRSFTQRVYTTGWVGGWLGKWGSSIDNTPHPLLIPSPPARNEST